MKPRIAVLVAAAAAVAFCQPAFAKKDRDRDDDDRRERHEGPRTKFDNNAEEYKYEYKDGRCKYKYEYKYKSGKTKIEQKGDCSGIAFARPAAHYEVLPRAIPPEPQAASVECNREVLGTVLGGAVGAVVGSRVGDRDERVITTVGGAVIGAVIGGAIGRDMDRADQACAAQALEYANLKQTVKWKSARGAQYTVTPLGFVPGGKGMECRRYIVRASHGGQQENEACRQANGTWVIVR